jgi:hypothetical protein
MQSTHGLCQIWFKPGATQQYYPLLHTTFWLANKIWGTSPLGYHLLNILLHSFSALMVMLILRELSVPGAWLAAFVFAVHPVCVESVAWISELKNVLSGFFYLLAAWTYLKFDQTRAPARYFAAFALFVAALLCKTVVATLPVALLIIFWWKRGKISWRQDARPLGPFFLVGIGAGIFTAWLERTSIIAGAAADFRFTLFQRCVIAGRAILFYLVKLVWPTRLTFIYPRWNVAHLPFSAILFPLAVLLMLVAAWRWARHGNRALLAGFLFFITSLFPALGFFDVYPFV